MSILTPVEKWLVTLANFGWPHVCVNDKLFRELVPDLPCRERIGPMMIALAQRLQKAALKLFTSATLCMDVGTVHTRYLVFVITDATYTLTYRVIPETAMVDDEMTGEQIGQAVDDAISALRDEGVLITGVVADNASNMRAAQRYMTPEVYVERCACHVIQLIVKDIGEKWQAAFEVAESLRQQHPKLPKSNDTRWNSKFRLILAAKDVASAADALVLDPAVAILRPFQIATDRLQSGDATAFMAMCEFETLYNTFVTGHPSIADAVYSRIKMWATPSYLLLAFFAPSANRTRENINRIYPDLQEALERYGVSADEFQRFINKAFPPFRGTHVSLVDYCAFLDRVAAFAPNLARCIKILLRATPSEASVERAFSHMRHGVNDYRSRLGTEVVEAQLQLKSAWACLQDQPVFTVASPSPKRPRSETPATPVTPTTAEVVSDSDVEEEESSCREIFDTIVDIYIAQRLQVTAERPPRAAPVRRTRKAADTCVLCQESIRNHTPQCYVECACGSRAGMGPVCMDLPAHRKLASYTKVDMEYECPACEGL
jgi:hypothetical protein